MDGNTQAETQTGEAMFVAPRSENDFSCKGNKNILKSVGNCLTYGFLIVISK